MLLPELHNYFTFYLGISSMKLKNPHEAFAPNIVEYDSKEPKYTNSGNTVNITAQKNANKCCVMWQTKNMGPSETVCACRAVVHLRLPQLWLDKNKIITLVCVQGGLRKSSFTTP